MSVEGASSWRQDVRSAENRPRPRRPSMGSRPSSFHQTKGKFAAGVLPINPERVNRLRKDALEDFNRATVERERSVHEMAAMFASTGSERSDRMGSAVEIASSEDGDSWKAGASRSSSFSSLKKGTSRLTADTVGSAASSEAGSMHGLGRPSDLQLDAPQLLGSMESSWGTSGSEAVKGDSTSRESSLAAPSYNAPQPLDKLDNAAVVTKHGSLGGNAVPITPRSQAQLSKFNTFSNPTTTDLRALDLKQQHLDEARKLASNRSSNVKDIANAFKGGSRSENVEVFHKKHAEQEAAYRCRVHEGKETLKKTSQGTDAMYNFVLKLNLATTEGKERFMRRWAVGRIANGEQPTPVEGWKFLQSLGIDVKSKKERRATTASHAPFSRQASAHLTAPSKLPLRKSMSAAKIMETVTTEEAPKAMKPTQARGRSPVRAAVQRFGSPRAGSIGMGFGGVGGVSEATGDSDHEVSAWEFAVERAVGTLNSKGDADACAPQLLRSRWRRRSGSEPRRSTPVLRQAPETCRPMRSTAFWGGVATTVPPAPLTSRPSKDDEPRDVSLSPPGSPVRFTLPQMWGDGQQRTPPRGRPSQPGGDTQDRRKSVLSVRTSDAFSCPNSTPPRGLRLTMGCPSNSSTRFSLSPSRSRSSERARPSHLVLGEESSLSSFHDDLNKGDVDAVLCSPGTLELPARLRVRTDPEPSDEDMDETQSDSEHEEFDDIGGNDVRLSYEVTSTRSRMRSGDTLQQLSKDAFPSDEEFETESEDREMGDDDEMDEDEDDDDDDDRFGDVADSSAHDLPLLVDIDSALAHRFGGKADSIGKLTIDDGDIEDAHGAVGRASDETEDAMARAQRLSEVQTRLSDSKLVLHGSLSDEDEDDAATIGYDHDDGNMHLDDLEMPGSLEPGKGNVMPELEDMPVSPRRVTNLDTNPWAAPEDERAILASSLPQESEGEVEYEEMAPHNAPNGFGSRVSKKRDIFALGLGPKGLADACCEVPRRGGTKAVEGFDIEKGEGCTVVRGGGMRTSNRDVKISIAGKLATAPVAVNSTIATVSAVASASIPVESSHGGSVDLTCKEVLSVSEGLSDAVSVSVYDADMSMSDAASERFSDQSSESAASVIACNEDIDGKHLGGVREIPDDASVSGSAADGDDEASTGLPRSSHKELKIAVGDDLQEEEPPVRRLQWGVTNIEVGSPFTPSRYDEGVVRSEDEGDATSMNVGDVVDPTTTTDRIIPYEDDLKSFLEQVHSTDADASSVSETNGQESRELVPSRADGRPCGENVGNGGVADAVPCIDHVPGEVVAFPGLITRALGSPREDSTDNHLDMAALAAAVSHTGILDRSPRKPGSGRAGNRSHRRQRSVLPADFSDDNLQRHLESVEAIDNEGSTADTASLGGARDETAGGARVDCSPRNRYDPSPRHRFDTSPRNRFDGSPRGHFTASPRKHFAVSPRGHLEASPRRHFEVSPRKRLGLSPKPMLMLDPSNPACCDGLKNIILSPRTPTSYRLDQLGDTMEALKTREAKPDASLEAGGHGKASISSPAVLSSDMGSSEADLDIGESGERASQTAEDMVDEIVAMCVKGMESNDVVGGLFGKDTRLVPPAVEESKDDQIDEDGCEEGSDEIEEDDDDGSVVRGECGIPDVIEEEDEDEEDEDTDEDELESSVEEDAEGKEVLDAPVNAGKERSMTGLTEDSASPSSNHARPSSNPGLPDEKPASHVSIENASSQEDENVARLSDIATTPPRSAPHEDSVVAPPRTPLANVTCDGASPAGSLNTPVDETSEESPSVMEQISIIPDAELIEDTSDAEDTADRDEGVAWKKSVDSVPILDEIYEEGNGDDEDDHDADDGPELGRGRTHTVVLEVDNANPYEDFDAVHDQQRIGLVASKPNCANALNLFGFCRPRSSTFHNNPSTRGSGVEFFPTAGDDAVSMSGTVSDVDRLLTPRSLFGFCTPRGRAYSLNPSTRGKGPGFFSTVEEDSDEAALQCPTSRDSGEVRHHSMNSRRRSSFGNKNRRQSKDSEGYPESLDEVGVKTVMDKLVDNAVAAGPDKAREGVVETPKLNADELVGDDTRDGLQQFFEERLGVECGVS